MDVVRRQPVLAHDTSQRYAAALLEREVSVLALVEVMVAGEAEEAARERAAAEEALKRHRAEQRDAEAEYQRVQVLGARWGRACRNRAPGARGSQAFLPLRTGAHCIAGCTCLRPPAPRCCCCCPHLHLPHLAAPPLPPAVAPPHAALCCALSCRAISRSPCPSRPCAPSGRGPCQPPQEGPAGQGHQGGGAPRAAARAGGPAGGAGREHRGRRRKQGQVGGEVRAGRLGLGGGAGACLPACLAGAAP